MTGLESWLTALLVALGMGAPGTPAAYQGYVEAEYVLIAPVVGGTLQTLSVRRGDQVERGAALFALDATEEQAARDQARALLDQARDRLANLEKGRRDPELNVIRAQRAQAAEQLHLAEIELSRQQRLLINGDTSRATYDQAQTAFDQGRARVAELDAQLAVALQPQGREDELRMAAGDIRAGVAALTQAQWRLDQKSVDAPEAGLITDTFFNPGELVAAGQAAVQLLPPGNIKVRFFVPQGELARVPVGAAVTILCDGCARPLPAIVRFVAPQAEYTPPVLYNRENRAKLVFMIEAWPTEHPELLRPGQPADVALGPAPARP